MSGTHPTVLVFGGGGWVGQVLVPRLARRFTVISPTSAEVDVSDETAVAGAVVASRPAAVVNLAARNPGSGDDAAMQAVNVVGARNVARAAREAGARLVHVSSDLVLDGTSPPYGDDAAANPVNAYGRSKAAGETAVLESLADVVVVRTSLIFDPGRMDRSTAGFAERLRTGQSCRLFVDEMRCPVARGTLCAALEELITSDARGVLNVCGTEALSRYTFGVRLLGWFGVAGLEAVERARAVDLAVLRPLDLTLDTSRALDLLSTPLRSVEEELTAAREGGEEEGKR